MTKTKFVDMPPLQASILGQEILLFPKVKEGGLCEYASLPMEHLIPVPDEDGKFIRVNGTFRLTPWSSKNWHVE
jgi:hypothetical protein